MNLTDQISSCINGILNKLCIAVSLLMFSIAFSCASTRGAIDATHTAEVMSHRQKTEEGLTVGDRAPLTKASLANLRYFDLDKNYKVIADVELSEGEEPFELPTYSGITKTFIKYATLSFELGGEELALSVYRNLEVIRMPQYKNYLFLPFKDETSSNSTYGGGRYINLSTLDIKEGKVTLDFNKCYNPWCAYSDGFNCPIPPAENTLDIAILAGEKNYAGK